MNRVAAAVAAPFRVGAAALTVVGGGISMLFTRVRSWGVVLARTLIDYRSEVGDPMRNSAVAAAVNWLARNFPEAPVRIRQLDRSGDDVFILPGPTGPGYMLRLLERPNPYYSGVLQWMATIVDFIQGDAYWVKVRAGDRPVQLWWVPRGMMRAAWPERDSSVFISHYEYTVDGVAYKIATRDVVHFRYGIDPRNPRQGLSPFGSLLREIFTDDEASNFTASLLRNLGVPGVILAPSNTAPAGQRSDPETVKKSFMEKFGGDKRGEPLVLTAPTDVKVLSWSPEQMNLRELRRIPEERITAVLGIPAIVANLGAGLDRSTFTNAGEANVSAYTQGVIPLHRLIAAELEVQLLDDFANLDRTPLDVEFDWTKSTAMSSAIDAVAKRALDAFKVGAISRAAYKRETGRLVQPGDDVYVYPNNYQTVPVSDARTVTPAGRPSSAIEGEWIEVRAEKPTTNGHHPQLTGAPA